MPLRKFQSIQLLTSRISKNKIMLDVEKLTCLTTVSAQLRSGVCEVSAGSCSMPVASWRPNADAAHLAQMLCAFNATDLWVNKGHSSFSCCLHHLSHHFVNQHKALSSCCCWHGLSHRFINQHKAFVIVLLLVLLEPPGLHSTQGICHPAAATMT